MSNNIIYKNKGEVFKCSFDIDGATSGDVKVRLCLEFNDNKNMFFHGKIDKKGNCTISIPKLSELDDKQGNLRVEAIIDDTYFNLYECPVELKNSVQMKIKESEGTFFNNSSSSSGVRVQFGKLEKEEAEELNEKKNPFKPTKEEPEEEEPEEPEEEEPEEPEEEEPEEPEEEEPEEPEEDKKGWKKVNPMDLWEKKKKKRESETPKEVEKDPEVQEKKPKSTGNFKSFQDFIAKKKK